MRTWVVANDLQIPWADPLALELMLTFVEDLKPHGVVLNGGRGGQLHAQ